MLFYDLAIVDHDLGPDPGLGMDYHVVAQDHAGANDRVVLDTAPFSYVGIIVDDTPGDRCI